MKRLRHGEMLPAAVVNEGQPNEGPPQLRSPFGFMFPELQDERDAQQNRLDDTPETVQNLRRLGAVMVDPGEGRIPGIPLAAIHNFFGQFVDHDITLERGSAKVQLSAPQVLSMAQIRERIVNFRTPQLDLDHVYGPDIEGALAPRDPENPDKLLVGEVRPGDKGLPKGKDARNDLPRNPDGEALIGDSRDDENMIVAQLHVAFLRAHNAIVDRGHNFDEARKLLTQHYQWIILHDFLEQIADPNIVKLVRNRGAKFFDPPKRSFFMPLEFSVAAFRFGHSKVRAAYEDFNELQPSGALDLLFRFAGERLPDEWVIRWPSFLDPEDPERFSRPIDTSLTELLTDLDPPQLGGQEPGQNNLAVRNLIRGLILRLPTGQAVANRMASQGIRPLTPEQILSVTEAIPGQSDFLKQTEEKSHFLTKTPLWFYILAEAAFYSRGHHLGPVGSTIVAEVLIYILRNSTDSILSDSRWRPTLGETAKFDLEDLLKLAGVFS